MDYPLRNTQKSIVDSFVSTMLFYIIFFFLPIPHMPPIREESIIIRKLKRVLRLSPPLSAKREIIRTIKKSAPPVTAPFKRPPLFNIFEAIIPEARPPAAAERDAKGAIKLSGRSAPTVIAENISIKIRVTAAPDKTEIIYAVIFGFPLPNGSFFIKINSRKIYGSFLLNITAIH